MANTLKLRFSSIKDFFSSKSDYLSYEMEAPYTDTYKVSFKKLKSVVIYNEKGIQILLANEDFEIDLTQGQIIKVVLYKGSSDIAELKVMALNHKAVLPYDPYNPVNTRKLRTHGDNSVDPLTPVKLNVKKRDDGNGLYINCNNPEKLTENDIGKALSRVNISNKKVFFTFEHNNFDKPFYYGYQVKNVGEKDLYITVLNMGYQLDGPGCWLGEREWVDFYNINFRHDPTNWTDKQKETFKDYFNFSNEYKAPKNQPITYRIPKGKYIYIMGGTTKDAYKHINVWKTADKTVCGGCSNGVVLFDVIGEAEGTFYVYTNENQVKENRTHQGYVVERDGHKFGSQYVGYDTCHGVVDTHFTATFNDSTPSQDIPVEYVNSYMVEEPLAKKPFMKLDVEEHTISKRYWVTHINPHSNHDGVGTDMTRYITVNQEGRTIVIDNDHLDGHGNISNVGNWMIDYLDCFTFVNQGDQDRELTINMKNTGSLCVFVRDKHGKVKQGTPMFTIMQKVDKGIEYHINDDFNYTVKVKAHSIVQFYVEYNLLANSCGNVVHKVTLK